VAIQITDISLFGKKAVCGINMEIVNRVVSIPCIPITIKGQLMKPNKTDLWQLVIPVFLAWQYYMDYVAIEGLCIAVTMWIGTYVLVKYGASKDTHIQLDPILGLPKLDSKWNRKDRIKDPSHKEYFYAPNLEATVYYYTFNKEGWKVVYLHEGSSTYERLSLKEFYKQFEPIENND
jgi:hypothetical protein